MSASGEFERLVALVTGGGSGIGEASALASGRLGLTRTAAIEAAGYGVRVNAVCAGFVRTPATEGHEEVIGKLVARVPLGRRAESSEIADAVTYLCSDHAAFVTGHGLVLDGAPSVSPID